MLVSMSKNLLIGIILTSLEVSFSSDELLPKRLDSPVHNPSLNSTHSNKLDTIFGSQTFEDPISISSCPLECFARPPHYAILTCANNLTSTERLAVKYIKCTLDRRKGELTLGDRESISELYPGVLSNLLNFRGEIPSVAGQLSVHLNLNMVYFDEFTLYGLESLVTEVRVLNVVSLNPESLLKMKHLRSFEIDSGQIPRPTSGNNSTSVTQESHAFIKLRPADLDVPISVNFETFCHQCIKTNSSALDYLVLVFKEADNQKHPTAKAFSLIFPQMCARKSAATGCADYNVSSTISNTLHSESAGKADSNNSLLIVLSVWCTILTIVLVLIVCTIHICTRQFTGRKTRLLWLLYNCGQSAPSLGDTSSHSFSSEYVNNHNDSTKHQAENGSIYPILNQYRSSLHSLSIKTRRSRSVNSVKERNPRLSSYHSSMQNGQLKDRQPLRRTIGSQTDFDRIDPEVVLYSTLQRGPPSPYELFFPEPPMRCASQYALSHPRYANTVDQMQRQNMSLYRVPSYVRYSPKEIPQWEQIRFERTITDKSYRLSNPENEVIGQSVVCNLPPLPPHSTSRYSALMSKKWSNDFIIDADK